MERLGNTRTERRDAFKPGGEQDPEQWVLPLCGDAVAVAGAVVLALGMEE